MVSDKQKYVNYFARLVDNLYNLNNRISSKDANEGIFSTSFFFLERTERCFIKTYEEKSGLDSFFLDLVHGNATWRFSKPDCAGLSLRLCLLCLKGQVTAERGIFVNK